MADSLMRFLFDQAPVRGEVVSLDQTWQEVLQRHDYPPLLQALLGELMAAAALLSATLKFDGALIMQLQGSGALQLLVVECNADLGMRATAKWQGEIRPQPLRDLLGKGRFIITLDPQNGQTPYQGIVELEGDSVAAILETTCCVPSSWKHASGLPPTGTAPPACCCRNCRKATATRMPGNARRCWPVR